MQLKPMHAKTISIPALALFTLATLSTLTAAIALGATGAAQAADVDFHSYGRSGIGSTTGGGDQACFLLL